MSKSTTLGTIVKNRFFFIFPEHLLFFNYHFILRGWRNMTFYFHKRGQVTVMPTTFYCRFIPVYIMFYVYLLYLSCFIILLEVRYIDAVNIRLSKTSYEFHI